MKVMSIVGARPNFMKVAPIISAIREHNDWVSAQAVSGTSGITAELIDHVLVHTGQHYDRAMSDVFFADLNMPRPDICLGVGSASHAVQTAEIIRQFEPVLLHEKPDALVVVGDVNSSFACALVAAKISFDSSGHRPVIAHIESGLRSFDRTMPEEINRILTDHLADLLFVTEESGLRNLASEGIPAGKTYFAGNTMIDSLWACNEKVDSSVILSDLGLRTIRPSQDSPRIERYSLLTLHRPSNVDDRCRFLDILRGLEDLAKDGTVVFPVHPRTEKRIAEFGLSDYFYRHDKARGCAAGGSESGKLMLIEPLGYLDFLNLMKHATLVVTDSGGVQEETTWLGVPCVTVRQNTERPVTVEVGTNVLAGVRAEAIRTAIQRQLTCQPRSVKPQNWDGHAAGRIVATLACVISAQGRPPHGDLL